MSEQAETNGSTPPRDEMRDYVGRGLLAGRRALVTGGDSGIGRAVAVAFAKEGADVALAYLNEHDDAAHTVELIKAEGRRALGLPGDLADSGHCGEVVDRSVAELGGLDILVNNVAYRNPADSIEDISDEQWRRTFAVNIDSFFYLTKRALRHLPDGSAIINTSSINGLRGNDHLLDYAATAGAVLAFTYSLAKQLTGRRIRVNCVAPAFPAEKVAGLGEQASMRRAAEPDEIAPSYVFFASDRLSSSSTGEVLADGQTWR